MKNSNLSVTRMARLMGQSLARPFTLGRFFPKARRNRETVNPFNRINNLAYHPPPQLHSLTVKR